MPFRYKNTHTWQWEGKRREVNEQNCVSNKWTAKKRREIPNKIHRRKPSPSMDFIGQTCVMGIKISLVLHPSIHSEPFTLCHIWYLWCDFLFFSRIAIWFSDGFKCLFERVRQHHLHFCKRSARNHKCKIRCVYAFWYSNDWRRRRFQSSIIHP